MSKTISLRCPICKARGGNFNPITFASHVECFHKLKFLDPLICGVNDPDEPGCDEVTTTFSDGLNLLDIASNPDA
jgi:hypothetical protein